MSENKGIRLFNKISETFGKEGRRLVYRTLLLYYAYRRKATPRWAKVVILGALGYFISMIDFIPDIIPAIGYTDDFFMMALAIATLSHYINGDVRSRAREKMNKWFPPTKAEEENISGKSNFSLSSRNTKQ
jgi:uncharacterized membrane protein YkvA (DUF1232 family)